MSEALTARDWERLRTVWPPPVVEFRKLMEVASRCERAEAALREMASRGCRGERMMGTHCKDVCLSPAQWCEPCAAEEALRALSGARP